MAKQWKSLWHDYDDEGNGPEETKKSSGPRPNPNYRGNNDDAVEDEFASDEYGGFGWNGKFSGGGGGSYRYDDAFDDSEDHWYRKNSFRYGKHADYSPSSLFRSAFSRSYSSSSGDNEATNRAIRALRNLTRSANTIVDKSTGIKNEFAVQFSSGADNNGTVAKLNDEKQRVVFVSPDSLLAAATTEDEDAVVDALTGFVLLRVQMAQDIATDVIDKINSTGAHLAGVKIAAQFVRPGARDMAKMTTEELHGMSETAVDEYLAGMLAKSVLMRLARRKVVLNWGGFAPYFIRHAKKFAAVKANLEAAALSAESVVSKLGYNMLADEEPIAIDKVFEDLAAKHLGDEVSMDNLLSTCRALVNDIRGALAADSAAVPGEMEAALNEMLDKAQAAQKAAGSGDSDLKDFLEKFAASLMTSNEASEKSRQEQTAADLKTDELSDKLRGTSSLEQLLKKLSAEIERMSEMLEAAKSENPAVAENARRQMTAIRANMSYLAQSRPQAVGAMQSAGMKPDLDAMLAECGKKHEMSLAEAQALKERVEALAEKAAKVAKAQRDALKKAVADSLADMSKRLAEARARAESEQERVNKVKADLAPANVAGAIKSSADGIMANILATLEQAIVRLKHAETEVAKHAAAAAGARSTATLDKAHKTARAGTAHAANNCGRFDPANYGWYHYDDTINQLLRALASLTSVGAKKAAEKAVSDVLNRRSVSPAGFAAAMARSAAGKAFDKLRADEDHARDEYDEDDAAEFDTEKADKEEIDTGLDKDVLAQINKLLEAMRSAGLDTSAATNLGTDAAAKLQKIQEESSPVDGELFGETIAINSKVLDSEAIGRVNDEARNDPEEEYIAYLSHNSAKPKIGTAKESHVTATRSVRSVVVGEVRKQHRGSIERVRSALQFQSGKRTAENFGLRSGDLDEGSLHKLGYDCDHIWSQKTISKLPDVAVGILVDQSGSMSGKKIANARTMCIILAEALKKIAGVRLYVYGHTANNGGHDLTIFEHYTPTNTDITALGGIQSHSNNYDGYAIKDVAKRLSLDTAKKKYLFVIADGLPSGHGYGGHEAEKHVTSVCKFIRDRLKIGLNAFAVGVPTHQQNAFKKQYGDDHVVFINDIMKCLPQIVRFLRNTLQKERKLVGIED